MPLGSSGKARAVGSEASGSVDSMTSRSPAAGGGSEDAARRGEGWKQECPDDDEGGDAEKPADDDVDEVVLTEIDPGEAADNRIREERQSPLAPDAGRDEGDKHRRGRV